MKVLYVIGLVAFLLAGWALAAAIFREEYLDEKAEQAERAAAERAAEADEQEAEEE